MTLTVELPAALEEHLRNQLPNLPTQAIEAMLVEFYRQDQLSRYQLGQALQLTRFETDALLKRHNVTEDLPTAEELAGDFQAALPLVKR